MLRNSLLLWPAAVAGLLCLNACNSSSSDKYDPAKADTPHTPGKPDQPLQKTASGIEYQIFRQQDGKYAPVETTPDTAAYRQRIGKIIALHVQYRTAKDSVMFDTRKQQMGYPVRVPLQPVVMKGGLEEAISMLQPGDSAVFRFNADSLSMKTTRQPAPAAVKKHGNTMLLYAKVDAIQTEAEATAAQQQIMQEFPAKMKKHEEEQKSKDDALIQDYVSDNNLGKDTFFDRLQFWKDANVQKTPSGVYYVVTQQGNGPKPTPGQIVSVQYRGTLLNGKEFDSSAKSNGGKPIDFPIGVQQVIPGWDEAIPMLNKGSKATLIIPSGLAYGARGAGADIPADAPLRFDVELVDVKAAPAAPQMPQMPPTSAPAEPAK